VCGAERDSSQVAADAPLVTMRDGTGRDLALVHRPRPGFDEVTEVGEALHSRFARAGEGPGVAGRMR